MTALKEERPIKLGVCEDQTSETIELKMVKRGYLKEVERIRRAIIHLEPARPAS